MPNTYTQLYVHIVFSVKGRQPLIPKQHKDELHKYITGIIAKGKQKMRSSPTSTDQEKHHSHKTFAEEYLEFLRRFDVPYNPKYVFDSIDNEAQE